MRFYFVRHGESEANVLREISNRGLKHPLTEKGRQQAAALAEQLKELPVTRLFSSPLLRAIQTAETLAQPWQIEIEPVDALREYDCGILEGKSDRATWDVYYHVLNDWMVHRKYDSRPDEGESFNDIRARFAPFVKNLLDNYRDTDANIVCVAHGGLYRCMLPLILQNIDTQYALDHVMTNCGYVLAEAIDGGIRCIEWCGVKVG